MYPLGILVTAISIRNVQLAWTHHPYLVLRPYTNCVTSTAQGLFG